MDLRFKTAMVRYAAVSMIFYMGVLLLLWSSSSIANPASTGHDYVLPGEISGGYLVGPSTTESSVKANKQSSSSSTYKAFDGRSWAMTGYSGRHVKLLLPQAEPNQWFTPDHIEELIDQLDIHYTLYTELMHVEPDGNGLLTVAFVPETCSMGCGLLGAKGIEILSDPLNYENIIRELDAGRLEAILVHEMAHNFDRYAKYLHYLPDHAHAWTDMFEFFAPYRYARSTRNFEAPDDIFNSPVRAVWKDYVSTEGADWETCVEGQDCLDQGMTANNLWAMIYYRIESLHGEEALLRSFEFLKEYAAGNPPPVTAVEKEGLRILSLAVGADTNIACYMDALKWPVDAAVRAELNQRFGPAGPLCQDADGDGFSAVNGDCDDEDPGRNILSKEIIGNGRDDDCDEQVDDASLVESEAGSNPDNYTKNVITRLPFEVEASLSDSADYDIFQFPLTGTRRARVTICSDGELTGWAVALDDDGEFLDAPVWNSYRPGAGCTSNTFDYGELHTARIAVMADESQGAYSLNVSEAAELPPELSVYLRVEPRAAGGVTLKIDDRDGLLAGLGTDELEFWVSGAGVQLFRPFSPQMTVSLSPAQLPGLVNGQDYQVRVRPRQQGLPLADFSAGRLFRYRAAAGASPAVDSGYSGAWYNPGHDGEGFLIEVLEDSKALVYWFTFDEKGNQRWMLGVGDTAAGRIDVDELVAGSGGRFGEQFDPDDVVLQTAGSLSISFQDCSSAIANFNVDGTGGHLALSRLTGIEGHGCGTSETPGTQDISGSWFDPSHNGEGFVVQRLASDQALLVWFTYDEDGRPSWVLSTGAVEGNHISIPELLQPTGGIFGRSFNPQTVTRSPWGGLELQLDCSGGTAQYTPTAAGYTAGQQNLVNLTRLQNSGCR